MRGKGEVESGASAFELAEARLQWRSRSLCARETKKQKNKKNARELTHFFKIVGSSLALAAFFELFSGIGPFLRSCVMPTGALRAPTSNGVTVARRGLHAVDLHSLGGIRVRTARFESTTPKVPGGTRPLYTLQRKFSKCMSIYLRTLRDLAEARLQGLDSSQVLR